MNEYILTNNNIITNLCLCPCIELLNRETPLKLKNGLCIDISIRKDDLNSLLLFSTHHKFCDPPSVRYQTEVRNHVDNVALNYYTKRAFSGVNDIANWFRLPVSNHNNKNCCHSLATTTVVGGAAIRIIYFLSPQSHTLGLQLCDYWILHHGWLCL